MTTDGRAHKLLRPPIFFPFSSHSDLLVSFFSVFISYFLSSPPPVVLSRLREQREGGEMREILTYCQPIEENQLMYER